MDRIAFVGLGSMGGPLALLIARSTFDIAVYDPFPASLEPFDGLARIAVSAADAANGADMACICVRDDKQVNEVLFGNAGLAEQLRPGALVLIHSTIAVAALEAIAERLHAQGIAVVDAPVSRTRQGSTEAPFVFTMLGGEPECVARATTLAETFSTSVEHMGPLGAGMTTKICNNMITWVHIVVGLQSVGLALRNGVELEKLLGVMRANGNLTPTMGAAIAGKCQAPLDAARAELYASQGGIGEKDLALALESAERAGLDLRMIREAQALVRGVMTNPV